jgi:hypothetical protein
MHLFAEEPRPQAPRQLGLFDGLETVDPETALKQVVIDKHGRFALRIAATLPLGPSYADRANAFDILRCHGKTCF